jgi:hypothetical protein
MVAPNAVNNQWYFKWNHKTITLQGRGNHEGLPLQKQKTGAQGAPIKFPIMNV